MMKHVHAPLENDQGESYHGSKPSTSLPLFTFTETLRPTLFWSFHLNQSPFYPLCPKGSHSCLSAKILTYSNSAWDSSSSFSFH